MPTKTPIRVLVDGQPDRGVRSLASRLGFTSGRQPGWLSAFEAPFRGEVLIIGAGAAGLAAGYALSRYGVDYTILEASDRIGGRVRRHPGLSDFPLDLGAEWLHAAPGLLPALLDGPEVGGDIDLISYRPRTIASWRRGRHRSHDWLRFFYREYKFRRTTWFDVFDRFVAPVVAPRVRLGLPVVGVDTTGERVVVTTAHGERLEADRVLVTASIMLLRAGAIDFNPPLDEARRAALDGAEPTSGLKVFSRFAERFYPDALVCGPLWRLFDEMNLAFYDAAFGKGSDSHILALFSIGDFAARCAELDDDAIVREALGRLDAIFDGRASRAHQASVVQNWSAEPWVRGGYSWAFASGHGAFIDTVGAPIDGRVFFAGEAFSREHQATVHGAMLSGYEAVERMLVS